MDLVEQDPSLRKVEWEEARQYAASIDAELFEVSSKSGMKVPECFTTVVSGYVKRTQGQSSPSHPSGIILDSKDNSKAKSGCC